MDVQDRGHGVQGEGLLARQAPQLVLARRGWEEEGLPQRQGKQPRTSDF